MSTSRSRSRGGESNAHRRINTKSTPDLEPPIQIPAHLYASRAVVHEQLGRDILYLLLVFRFINALSIRTFFQPDEYFQALEPAWDWAFGSGSGAWITWEWHYQLRSSLHPALFAALYYGADNFMKALSMYPQFRAMILVVLPRILQGGIAAFGDYYTWKLAENIYGQGSKTAWTALLLTVLSPWQWFCSTRTFSNSLEMVLTIVALYHWPWTLYEGATTSSKSTPESPELNTSKGLWTTADIKSMRICFFLAGIACLLRPTNLLIWISLVSVSFTRLGLVGTSHATFGDFLVMMRYIAEYGLLALAVSAAADYFYFGFLTFPPYQWLTFNITKGLAVFYGVNDWHYYLSQGLPLLLTTYLPFGLIALWSSTSLSSPGIPTSITNTRFQLAFTVLVTLITLSLISHKEVRFIYPLLPLLHLLLAPHVVSFFTATPLPSVLTASISSLNSNNKIPRPRRLLLILLLSLNVVISIYTTQFHQRGVLSVISYLRTEYESLHLNELGQPLVASPSDNNSLQNTDADTEIFAAFLMPCHSTPWRSHLVYPGLKAWALTCEPPINIPANSTERKAYRDEADRFYDDPKKFLEEEIGGRERPWPRFVVGFEGIESVLRRYYEEAMKGWTVRRRWEGFNSHWHDDARRVGNVVVWEFVEKEGQGKKDEEAQERIEEEKPRTRGL